MRLKFRGLLLLIGLLALSSVFQTMTAPAAVKSVSTDGEATVYLMGNFSGTFDVAYSASLALAAHNKSWSALTILLVGTIIPCPGASIGLASGYPNARTLTAFTDVTYSSLRNSYKSQRVNCPIRCVIELRGNKNNIYAFLDGKRLATWPRVDLSLIKPSIQLNAEAHGVGDVINASLVRIRTIAGGRILPHPTCAFTTRGVEPSGTTNFKFTGTNRNAAGAFIALATGAHSDKC